MPYFPPAGSGGGYNLVQDEGTSLAVRTTLDFVGAGVTASDVGGETQINIPGGGALAFTEVEVGLGSIPRRAGRFTITGAGLTANKPVNIQKANGPYSGKGTRSDEAEMDGITVSGKVLNTTTIECFWQSPSPVKGNIKFHYFVGA